MTDYTKLTKAELIEKLNEQKHLAEAVEAKDKEISVLNKKHIEEVSKLQTEHKNKVDTLSRTYNGYIAPDAVTARDKELDDLRKQIVTMVPKDKIEASLKSYEEKNIQLAEIGNAYLTSYRSTVKLLQGITEILSQNEALISEKIKL